MGIWLVMRSANGQERPFPVNDRITIGRETRCNVRIAVPSVSERHCEIVVERGVPRLADLDAGPRHSGTFHNGSRVREAVLNHADRLTIGPVTFEVRIETEPKDATSSAASMNCASTEVRSKPFDPGSAG